MSKAKHKRCIRSNSAQKEKVNPFEVRVNKVKHNALGRRVCKNEIGRPFESRNKAFKKRKNTLFGEYKRKDKRGKGIIDRRLKDEGTGVELRKASVWKIKNSIALESASLTHKGVSLNDIDLKESYSDLDDDDNEVDLLRRGDYVESAHFGGGESGAARSAKEFMDEVMDEKRRKQVEKEANIELTERLDKDWLSIKNLLQHKGLKPEVTENTSNDYDVLVKELAFSNNQQKSKIEIVKNDLGKSVIGKNQQFLEKVNEMLSYSDVVRVSSLLKSLNEFQSLNSETVDILKLAMQEIRYISLQSISLLLLCSQIRGLKDCYYVKSVQLLRNTKLSSITSIVKSMSLIHLLMNSCEDIFFPEVIQTLQNILVLCLGEKYSSFFRPVFDMTRITKKDILCISNCSSVDFVTLDLNFTSVFSPEIAFNSSDKFKMSVIKGLIKLISVVACKYKSLPSFNEIFFNISCLIEKLCERYPSHLFSIDSVEATFKEKVAKKFLFRDKAKPLMLPLFEPRIESSRRQESNRKLIKKYKRELKGAQRELKKDSQFLKDVWLKETLKKDKDRKQKVKQLFAELATESSLYKKKK